MARDEARFRRNGQGWSLRAVRSAVPIHHPSTCDHVAWIHPTWKAGGFHFHPESCRTLFRTAWKAIPAIAGLIPCHSGHASLIPGGMKACSRGLSAATPPDFRWHHPHPGQGCWRFPHGRHVRLAHLRRAMDDFHSHPGEPLIPRSTARLQAEIPPRSGIAKGPLIRLSSFGNDFWQSV